MEIIDVGKDFYPRLANRHKGQGDGKHTAEEFREKYLVGLDNQEEWKKPGVFIILDFSNVTKIGPSFANEVFAYFTTYATPDQILKKIEIRNASEVQRSIIGEELKAGYTRR